MLTLKHSDKTLTLDDDEVLGLLQAARFPGVAGYFTDRAGGRADQNVRLVGLFDPRLVNLWLVGALDRDVENPVTDHGFDTAPVSHVYSIDSYYTGSASSRIWIPFVTLRTPVRSAIIALAAARSAAQRTAPESVCQGPHRSGRARPRYKRPRPAPLPPYSLLIPF